MPLKTLFKILFAVTLAAALLGSALVVVNWVQYKRIVRKEAQKTGHPFKGAEVLIPALEQYMVDHGRAPDALVQLVPDHVAEVPAPGWGTNKWLYKPELNGSNYSLSVKLYDDYYAAQYYQREKGTWWFDN